MAESSLQDVALNTQSVGDKLPSDASAITTYKTFIEGDAEEGSLVKENGVGNEDHTSARNDDHILEDGSARSDTDNSRANSVSGEARPTDSKPVKKFVASKPTTFAKYSVPKTVTANAPPKVAMAPAPVPSNISMSSSALGRPRLVAKTTISNQQKLSSYKAAAPDPMQVWNKNRATPQTSTKHLTDEELKQQYGIHLTSRLQSDNDGKEAKWADIDDDEDDWAPETIEWNDGTKTTVNPADSLSSKQAPAGDGEAADSTKSPAAPKPVGPQYSSSVGPNATVLKLGANAERQQAQKALAHQARGSIERSPNLTTKASPAPAPAKSPWAKLPEVDKALPIAINPQPISAQTRYPPLGPQPPAPAGAVSSPAKEISADDFNRSWRDSPSSQTRELFMPGSGRYETVPDGKRRMSKNEQNFRAPAVLQRPSQRDTRAPAEPSAAFQTTRNSMDQGRRRASSSISGGSGQFARRMSFKSTDSPIVSQPDSTVQRPLSRDEPSPQAQTPTYQARVGEQPTSNAEVSTEADLEAQRAAQKALMREKIEKARQRKLEEEARLEAEKQERIRLKLLSLGPPPEPVKPKVEDPSSEKQAEPSPVATTAAPNRTPPKPPQPQASGEPQQYGMMTVHPLDSVKRPSPVESQLTEATKSPAETHSLTQQPVSDKVKLPSPLVNGARLATDSTKQTVEEGHVSELGNKFGKPMNPIAGDARASWGSARNDHRAPPSSNLWGLPNNKALGNGTFDSSLAGYSPQDLSRTSSSGQGWMNGRTPTVGQSPQMNHVSQHVPETRSHLLQSMTSPDSQPLGLNSEIDLALPMSRPAPIGRPQVQAQAQAPAPSQAQVQSPHLGPASNVNGASPNSRQAEALAGWNNFQHVARAQERAENERFTREFNERREEEKRTGVRQQAPYNFQETFKQVQLGDQASQRHVAQTTQTAHAPNTIFGAVGSMPPPTDISRVTNGAMNRGSRFFPQQANGPYTHERRAVTYSHPEVPRSPSPPPAEEYSSLHPAFDGDYSHPKVHFPREKAVVRLPPPPPARLPTPPVETPVVPPQPKIPLTWAARVSMPAPTPAPAPVRSVSSPLVNNPSWQERFNGLLFPKAQQVATRAQPAPALASTREPLDITPAVSEASVSLPWVHMTSSEDDDDDDASSKKVEDEEDLFEDREAGSLPTIHFPRDVVPLPYPFATLPRALPAPVEANSIHMFMVSNWSERYGYAKPQYAVVKAPGSNGKGIKRDLPVKASNGMATARPRTTFPTKHHARPKPSVKPRSASKAH